MSMAAGQGWGSAGRGGFLRVLGIIYLIKLIRQRRRERREPAEADDTRES
jgi:hypothetical protein